MVCQRIHQLIVEVLAAFSELFDFTHMFSLFFSFISLINMLLATVDSCSGNQNVYNQSRAKYGVCKQLVNLFFLRCLCKHDEENVNSGQASWICK